MEPLRYLVQANLILTVLVLAYALLLRRTTRFTLNRVVLWIIAFEAVCLPFAKLPTVQPEPVRAMVHQTTEVFRKPFNALTPTKPEVFFTMPNGKTYPATFNATAARFPNWQTVLWVLYGLVVLGLLVRLAWRIVRLRVLIESGIWTQYTDFVLVQAPVEAPFSFGRFVVLNTRQYSYQELDQILRHERVHVSQHHTLDVLLAECLTIVYWFNPATYLLRQLVSQNLEYLADRGVLNEGVDARAYQFSLLRVSIGTCGPTLANRFGESGIKDRINMMLRPRSGVWVWLRYWLLAGVLAVVVLVLAVREPSDKSNKPIQLPSGQFINELTHSPTAELLHKALQQDDRYVVWFYFHKMPNTRWSTNSESVIGLANNRLILLEPHRYETDVYINGELAKPNDLNQIEAEYIEQLFVIHQGEYAKVSDPKPWRVLLQISHKPVIPNQAAKRFLTYLQAAAISDHPLGSSYSFSMNDVLEATFFHRKNVMVERTKNEHLKLYDEFATDTEVLINGIPVPVSDIQTVHVREVARIYTIERSFEKWFGVNKPAKRFAINIETSPKRAKRDSSYYVFSPFYSGDF